VAAMVYLEVTVIDRSSAAEYEALCLKIGELMEAADLEIGGVFTEILPGSPAWNERGDEAL
jgi:hypothetical protein